MQTVVETECGTGKQIEKEQQKWKEGVGQTGKWMKSLSTAEMKEVWKNPGSLAYWRGTIEHAQLCVRSPCDNGKVWHTAVVFRWYLISFNSLSLAKFLYCRGSADLISYMGALRLRTIWDLRINKGMGHHKTPVLLQQPLFGYGTVSVKLLRSGRVWDVSIRFSCYDE